ncbi:AAA family ATPase [Persicobacter diffluens]
MKRLPIGQSDFRQIRNEDAYYIDKSLFIEELMRNNAQTLLLPRPRRFGKTLNMSMLNYFFDIDHAEEYRGLFSGLAIEQSEEWQHQGKYPVIFLTFKDLKHETFVEFIIKFQKMLQEYTEEHFEYLLESDQFLRSEKRYLDRIVENEADHSDLEEYLRKMAKVLKKHHGIGPILLIDEYDAPIHAAFEYGYLSEMVGFMRNFLSAGFKDKDLITKGAITGILRVAKEDIFSGLNNLVTYSILDYEFADKFGLTQTEVNQLMDDAGYSADRQKVANWYNGYTFGQVEKIYNPWSILNFVSRHEEGLKPYWVNTSSNKLIQETLPKIDAPTQELLFDLLQGKSVRARLADFTIFEDLYSGDSKVVLGLLIFSGYLTTDGTALDPGRLEYKLRVPNEEIRIMYETMLARYLKASEKVSENELLVALLEQKPQTFADALKRYLLHSFSFFDIGTKGFLPEKIYHAFMLGLMAHLNQEYHVKSNRESGLGRADLIIYPKDAKNPKGWVLEFKKKTLDDPESLEELAQSALEQIHEQQYVAELNGHGKIEIMCMGIAFDGKQAACAFQVR